MITKLDDTPPPARADYRYQHPQSLYHSDDRFPDHLQYFSADLLAGLFVLRLQRRRQRSRRSWSACRTIATCWAIRTSGAISRSPPNTCSFRSPDRWWSVSALPLLLNRAIPFKGLITTLAAVADDDVGSRRRAVLAAAVQPVLGRDQLRLRPWRFCLAVRSRTAALYAVAITDIWMWAPFVMLLSLAGLSAVPKHLYEAAAIDRASSWYTFTRITLPLVAPLLLIAIIFRTMEAFKTFDLAYIMSVQPTTELIAIRLYKLAFQEWQTGRSCALAYIVLIMVLAITNIYVKYLNQVKER